MNYKEGRDLRVAFYVTANEKSIIEAKAAMSGVSVSTYCRIKALELDKLKEETKNENNKNSD